MAKEGNKNICQFIDQSYYAVLGCSKDATTDELKQAYQRLVRIHHPDKANLIQDCGNFCNANFLQIQKAWDTLRDDQLRSKYDAKLSCMEYSNYLLFDTISLSEMEHNEEDLTYPCRCGGLYRLDKENHNETKQVVVPCDECSFSIAINLAV